MRRSTLPVGRALRDHSIRSRTIPAKAAAFSNGASMLADRIASELRMKLEFKQALLEVLEPRHRLEIIVAYFNQKTEAEEKWKTLLKRVANMQR
jgi:ATP-dependent Lon protease